MAFGHTPRSPTTSPGATSFATPGHAARSPGKQALTDLLAPVPLAPGTASPLEAALDAAAQSPGQPVAAPIRARVEAASGADLSDVRVHDGPASDRAASAISAQAYADGQHV